MQKNNFVNVNGIYSLAIGAIVSHITSRIYIDNAITRGINAEYALGQYNALARVIRAGDLDLFVQLHNETENDRKICLSDVEKIYSKEV